MVISLKDLKWALKFSWAAFLFKLQNSVQEILRFHLLFSDKNSEDTQLFSELVKQK